MNTLILKLNASGDVVRTTAVLHELAGNVTWVTASLNKELLEGLSGRLRCLSWEERHRARDRTYDLIISLEDDLTAGAFLETVSRRRIFGAWPDGTRGIAYSADSRQWFDMSLISEHGRARADELKFQNRRSYQDLLFEGLGWRFEGATYLLPRPRPTRLVGDVALAPVAGPAWPMKGWAYYSELKRALESDGLVVNTLPRRPSLLEHLGDIANHRCLVSGDSLPMHLALGLGVRCVTLFNCTSPWEIYDYGVQTKVISPLLEQYFYSRDEDFRATTAIRLSDVYTAVVAQINASHE